MTASYVEHAPPPALADIVACTWEHVPGDLHRDQLIVPDACVDLVFTGDRLILAGPDTSARSAPIRPGEHVYGLRFRPGTARAVLSLPVGEIRDAAPALAEVLPGLGRRLAEEDPPACPQALLDALAPRLVTAVRGRDRLVGAAVARMRAPATKVAGLARDLGISERQLRRRFEAEVGYGPKTLDRILRFQRLIALAEGEAARGHELDLARLALDAGYADQAHMTTDVRRLAGRPAVRFFKDRLGVPA